jgi:TRAP-type transport system periplasmic protein
MYSPAPLLVSKKFWDTLNDQEKKALQKASDEARGYQREVNQKENETALKVLKDKGMVVTDLTPEARQEFIDKLKPIYDKYKKDFGEDLVNKVLEATK